MVEYIAKEAVLDAIERTCLNEDECASAINEIPTLKSVYMLEFVCQEGENITRVFSTYAAAYVAMSKEVGNQITSAVDEGCSYNYSKNEFNAEVYCAELNIYDEWYITEMEIW